MSRERAHSIAISGATGLVGTALTSALRNAGHTCLPLSRKPSTSNSIEWDPAKGVLRPRELEPVQTIVHLAGENIAGRRWTPAVKERIRSSRVDGTRNLVRSIANLEHRPSTFVCASAIGIYGHRDEVLLNESSTAGTGYLADVCKAWEAEALAAAELGLRVVCVRIGVVLSSKGGALAKMLLPFKMGVGGVIGSGKQYWSWIGLTDLVRTIVFCIQNEGIEGPVNAVSPTALTNYDFTKTLGRVLHRPTVFPMPAFVARLALGEMADELLLSSARVVPQKLQSTGFQFEHPDLETCLEHELL